MNDPTHMYLNKAEKGISQTEGNAKTQSVNKQNGQNFVPSKLKILRFSFHSKFWMTCVPRVHLSTNPTYYQSYSRFLLLAVYIMYSKPCISVKYRLLLGYHLKYSSSQRIRSGRYY
jgi:hypothetical protein